MPFTKIAAAGIATTGLVTLERLDVTNNVNTTGIITASGGIKASLLGTASLVSISSTITATATDVFVYDTRKDSDGGAWRKRTQHTSWYNENLNTASRGSRRDFPAVAVLVLTSGSLTIYDGDDPDMPMWMVFNTGSLGVWLGRTLSTKTSVFMLNGEVCVGGSYISSHYEALIQINFIKETALHTDTNGRVVFSGNIYNRNTVNSYYTDTSLSTIVNLTAVNDVAMTVLPNAPIDSTTGLPVPTIAVATQGGVSILKDDGTVINGTSSTGSAYSYVKVLTITDERYLWFLADSYDSYNTLRDSYALSLNALPSSNFTWNNSTDNLTAGLYYAVTTGNEGGEIKIGPVNTWSWSKQERNALGSPSGLAIHKPNIGAETNSLIVGITSTYNTGWMHGDIKGAFLSDTSTTSVTGTELVTNGTFTTDTTGWTANGSGSHTFSVVSGTLQIVRGSSGLGAGEPYQNITLTAGKTYILSWQVTSGDMTTALYDGTIGGSALVAVNSGGTGYFFRQFTVTTTGTKQLLFISNNANSTTAVDNVSIREAELDRSINNKGLQVLGTITKTAVATGADLVAYSGFNSSNGLIQPYNSAFDFGTGDYYMSVWAYGGGDGQVLMVREHGTSDADGSILLFQQSNSYAFYSRQDGTGTWTSTLSSTGYGSRWNHVTMVRTGGILYGYVNGKLETSIAFSGNVTNNDATLNIGRRNPSVNTQYFTGQLALAKIGAGAPSPDQITKIYNDEKMLFQANSKATLYGTSSAVTALAYDDSTRLLYAGTSSGRSDFQGLERINNTTTAVTTAISASNGLVAEQ